MCPTTEVASEANYFAEKEVSCADGYLCQYCLAWRETKVCIRNTAVEARTLSPPSPTICFTRKNSTPKPRVPDSLIHRFNSSGTRSRRPRRWVRASSFSLWQKGRRTSVSTVGSLRHAVWCDSCLSFQPPRCLGGPAE